MRISDWSSDVCSSDLPDDRNEIGNALILGIMGGAMCWAATMRVVSGLWTSIDLATARLAAAARNDLTSPVPKDVRRDLPNLAGAMENLFGQFRSNLKNAQTLEIGRASCRERVCQYV